MAAVVPALVVAVLARRAPVPQMLGVLVVPAVPVPITDARAVETAEAHSVAVTVATAAGTELEAPERQPAPPSRRSPAARLPFRRRSW